LGVWGGEEEGGVLVSLDIGLLVIGLCDVKREGGESGYRKEGLRRMKTFIAAERWRLTEREGKKRNCGLVEGLGPLRRGERK